MSTEEKEQLKSHFASVGRLAFRVTLLQVLGLAFCLWQLFAWYSERDEKKVFDDTRIYNKIDNLSLTLHQNRQVDSLRSLSQRYVDSVILASRLIDLKKAIIADLSARFAQSEARITKLEQSRTYQVDGIKKRLTEDKSGTVTIKPTQNK